MNINEYNDNQNPVDISIERLEAGADAFTLEVIINKGVRFKEQCVRVYYADNQPYMWAYKDVQGSGGSNHNLQELLDLHQLLNAIPIKDIQNASRY